MSQHFEQLNFNSSKPLYSQITDIIEKMIKDKEIPVGGKLPPQNDLRKIFNVSIDTMRVALSQLVKEGYISCRPTHGTIVISDSPQKGPNMVKNSMVCFVTCTGPLRRTLNNPYFYSFISGAESSAREKGISLMCKTLSASDEELIFNGNEKNVSGLIVAGQPMAGHIKMIKKTRIPFILIGDVYQKERTDEGADVLTTDDFRNTYDAAKYLAGLGHRRIAMLASRPNTYPWDREELNGYSQALKDSGLEPDENLVVNAGSNTEDDICMAMRALIDKGAAFTALILTSLPKLYLCTMKVFSERNMRVPDDVSIIAVDDMPGLTRITANAEDVGSLAFQRLFMRLTDPGWKPERVKIECRLIEGSTTRKL
ncbi:MAG: hypothetical protein A2297_06340 [Elusimicrobia bacterium RIFOXYB2_FULL_48_7]|nr:MAG: hypothetical protein A2297_06340 [Elusimicrobia bacterium RIFOXYB2_FULL_48_7]